MTTYYSYANTPIGELLVAVADDGAVVRIAFEGEGDARKPRKEWIRDDRRLDALRTQLAEYFAGTRRAFDVDVAPEGTEFQKRVWAALCGIPYGDTRSYGAIANAIGKPTASRAVGAANGSNPIPIVIPCHRVLGSDGSLHGYSGGGGIQTKKWLLQLEGAALPQ